MGKDEDESWGDFFHKMGAETITEDRVREIVNEEIAKLLLFLQSSEKKKG